MQRLRLKRRAIRMGGRWSGAGGEDDGTADGNKAERAAGGGGKVGGRKRLGRVVLQ